MRRDAAVWAGALAVAAALWALESRWYGLAVLVSAGLLFGRQRRPAGRQRRRRVWSDEERRFILDRDGWRCVYCGSTDELEIDHIVPFSRGGACSIDNAQVLCGPCNRSKGAS